MRIDYKKAFMWQTWNKIINAVRKEKGLPLLPRDNPYLPGGGIYRDEILKAAGIDIDDDDGDDDDMDKGLEEEDGIYQGKYLEREV